MNLETPLTMKRTTFLSTEGCSLPFYEVFDSTGELIMCTESEHDKENFTELVRRANAYDTACKLIQFVVDKYGVKSIDEFTCPLHRKLAEFTEPKYAEQQP